MINKKGYGKYLSIWWFFILVIITLSIVSGTLLSFSHTIDTREIETKIMAEKIIGCLIINGKLNNIIKNDSLNLLESCGFDNKTIENGNYYLKINLKQKCNEKKCYERNIECGDKAFLKDCGITKKIKSEKYPKCYYKYLYTIDEMGNSYMIHIITASNNKGKSLAFKNEN